MPRTPAPLTVELSDNMAGVSEYYDIEWTVLKDHVVIAAFKEEADARAFVALPALQEAADAAITFLKSVEWNDRSSETDAGDLIEQFRAALAQADGPSPKE